MSRHQPVKHTCPDIDRCQKLLRDAAAEMQTALDYVWEVVHHVDDLPEWAQRKLREALESGENAKYLIDFEAELEQLRESNDSLREWGYDLRKEIEQLEKNS